MALWEGLPDRVLLTRLEAISLARGDLVWELAGGVVLGRIVVVHGSTTLRKSYLLILALLKALSLA